MRVARLLFHKAILVITFRATSNCCTHNGKGPLLLATRAICIALAPGTKTAKASPWARPGVAFLEILFEVFVFTFLASVLGQFSLDEIIVLVTTIALCIARGPSLPLTLTINGAWLGVVAGSGVRGISTVGALHTTICRSMRDGVLPHGIATATGGGAITEF